MERLWTFLTYVHALAGPVLMLLYPLIPVWYTVKLAFVAWLVLQQFRGAAFIYEKLVREKIINKYGLLNHYKYPDGKGKTKFVASITPKKGEHEAY
ncbi:unnamed protein product [Ilex paraguariensis]|uniref:HVA22-like protein n=1 Tax=Ilex paraguariensis TaxID=185542 RepID=A0ABC8R0Q9_9AQUA